MNNEQGRSRPLIDYFAPVGEEEAILRRIKGHERRKQVAHDRGPSGARRLKRPWLDEDLPAFFKDIMGSHHPRLRGGEDLPNLAPGQVEVARVVLVDSLHGEVTSLRATRLTNGRIRYEMVDEYMADGGYVLKLHIPESDGPLTADEVLDQFEQGGPDVLSPWCKRAFFSPFHPDLDELAARRGLKEPTSKPRP